MDGSSLIGARRVAGTHSFHGIEAATGAPLPGDFWVTPPEAVEQACALAAAAFDTFRETTPDARANFLETIAAALEEKGKALAKVYVGSLSLFAVQFCENLYNTCQKTAN
jgi:alpha-ketoglutaric semialdehyde dehydrogenase